MKTLLAIALLFVLTGCRVYPAQHHAVQPEVVTHYTWWNNLVERPIVYIEIYNTTDEPYEDFTLRAKAFAADGTVIGAFNVHKSFVLNPGERRSFRIALPGRNAQSVKVYMIGYDGTAAGASDHITQSMTEEFGLELP